MDAVRNEDKPLLLVFPYNVMAHYLRCLQLAQYLSPYFSIRFLYSQQYHSFVSMAGFTTFKCAALDSKKVQQSVETFDFSWLNYHDLNHIYKEQLQVITELKASAVLGDTSPTLQMAADKADAFYFSLMNGYMTSHYAYIRRMPKRYPLYKIFNLLPNSLFRYFTNVGEHLFFSDLHRPFSKIRKREELPARYSYLHELEGDVNLICDLHDLFPQKNLPFNYYFIPPLYYALNNDDHPVLEQLDPNKKTLLVNMGSTGDWRKVAFLNEPLYNKYNIITAADNDQVIRGSNVFAYPFISSARVFAKADLVICHGGSGTVYQALSHAVPVVCITSNLEQDYNVDGLERAQLGASIDQGATDDYAAVIDEWVQKKGNKDLSLVRDKITTAIEDFGEVIDAIVARTPYNKKVPDNQYSRRIPCK